MRRAARAVATLTLLAAAAVPAGAMSPPPPHADPACTRTSWVAGTVDLCQGTLIYRDYVYDDYGAHHSVLSRTAPSTGPLARPYGADRYPAGAEATADIVDLSLRIAGDQLEAVFELNALHWPNQTRAVLLVDTDNDPATESRAALIPAAQGVVWRGAEVARSGAKGDPETNTITLRFPLPPGEVWRVGAYTMQEPAGTVMNVAFRGRELSTPHSGSAWFEERQATALRDGDISEFGHVVRVDDLRRGVTRAAAPVTGLQSRVYTSAHTLPPGEGMSYTRPHHGRHGDTGTVCEQEFHFFGKYQPYALYVPEQPGPHGVQLALHGCSAGMTSLVNQPGMQANVGEARNRIVVVPLGRGPYGYYSDISERDVLDVLADVSASHPVDPDRLFAGGYSMGGYGAYRLAALYPDRFAGAISWVGFTGDAHNNSVGPSPGSEPTGAIGNAIDFVRNLRHIPTAMLYGGADELVHAQSAVAMQQRFAAEQGGAYEWFFHPAGEHFTLGLADDWRKESDWTAELSRVQHPAHVVYRTDASLAYPEYGIAHDRAYWVSGIDARDAGYADVDAQTFACGGTQPAHTEGARQGPDPVPWHSQNRLVSGSRPLPLEPRLQVTLANVAALTVDVEQTCLAGKAVAYTVTTDAPATLRLSDGRSATFAAAGTHEGEIPVGGMPAGDPGVLPATGAGLGAVSLGALGLAALAAGQLASGYGHNSSRSVRSSRRSRRRARV